jgi:hypothetical protein
MQPSLDSRILLVILPSRLPWNKNLFGLNSRNLLAIPTTLDFLEMETHLVWTVEFY